MSQTIGSVSFNKDGRLVGATRGSPDLEREFDDPGRQELIAKIAERLDPSDVGLLRGFLWLADMDCLRTIVENPDNLQQMLDRPELSHRLREWLSSYHRSKPTRHAAAANKRSSCEKQKNACKIRDKSKCILTHGRVDYVTPIFPGSSDIEMRSDDSEGNIWDLLQTFWSEQSVNQWKQAVHRNAGAFPYDCSNLLCFNMSVYWLYTRGYFAFKPLETSPDGTKLVLQFFWLQRGDNDHNSIQDRPSLQVEKWYKGANKAFIVNIENSQVMSSGDLIKMKTDDPINRPLPDFHILQMQWFQQRASAIASTSAEDYDTDDDDDDDDDDNDEDLVSDLDEVDTVRVRCPTCDTVYRAKPLSDGSDVNAGDMDDSESQIVHRLEPPSGGREDSDSSAVDMDDCESQIVHCQDPPSSRREDSDIGMVDEDDLARHVPCL